MAKLKYILIISLLGYSCNFLSEDLKEITYNNPIKIGVLNSTSYNRAWCETLNLAAFMAAEEINDAGGITIGSTDHDLELVFADDAGSSTTGLTAVETLKNNNIDIIIGPAYSGVTLGIYSYTTSNNMLLIPFSATSDTISGLHSMIWRTCPPDKYQGELAGQYVFNQGRVRAGIIYRNDTWGDNLRTQFKTAFQTAGGTVVSEVPFDPTVVSSSSDFSSYLDTLFAPDPQPDVIYLISYGSRGAKITNDIVQGGYISSSYTPDFVSNDGVYGSNFLANGNTQVLEGMYGTAPGGNSTSSNYLLFKNNYITRFGFEPNSYCEYIYDNVYLAAYAMQLAQDSSAAAVQAQLQKVSILTTSETKIYVDNFSGGKSALGTSGTGDIDYEGASGPIDFNSDRDPGKANYQIWKIENRQFTIIDADNQVTITP
ncbi:MAG: amino acid ABC transporter substrate-binding protein [bacterium]|nr:amino acid ABC transporter substrate-binding protein [bacterium]